jgi:hypothetical protein
MEDAGVLLALTRTSGMKRWMAKARPAVPAPNKEIDLNASWKNFDLKHDLTDKGIKRFVDDYKSTLKSGRMTRCWMTVPIFVAREWFVEGKPMIRKLTSGQYRLYSRKMDPKTGKRRNLGTFGTRKAAEAHERAVQYFKRHG